MALAPLGAVSRLKRLIADKAYDVDSLRRWLKEHRSKAVVPSSPNRTVPYPFNRPTYRR
jgi:IS5 family transposase